jgi:siderophore synthetase component
VSLVDPPELTAERWQRAGEALLAKLIAELSFEQALRPTEAGPGRYAATLGEVAYEFAGRPAAMGSWRCEPGSVRRDGVPSGDPFQFLLDLHAAWGLDPATTALTVGELNATLAADAHLLATGLPVAELAELTHIELEGYQTGHPWIAANKGRVGFSATDRLAYAPESRRSRRLPWMAVHRDLASYHGVERLDEAALLAHELDADTRARFTAALTGRGLDPAGYVWLPVHPWQWDEVVVPLFAGEIADGRVVPLAEAPDEYRPQQSIRTFTNMSRPGGLDVKLSLSILNTMVYRGIPTELVRAAPHSTTWIHGIRDADEFLRDECRVILPGEVAAVAVGHPVLEALPAAPYRYKQLVGALWREPVGSYLDPGERARTLAALLHTDADGDAFVAELVRRSALAPVEWLERLFAAIFPPLLHLLYRYGLAFNPHGENAIVVYDSSDVPVRLAVKDFVDDMKLLATDLPEYADRPAEALGVLLRCTPEELCGSFFKSLFTGHFRYLAPLCADQLGVAEERFWGLVRDQVIGYQKRFPALAGRFALFDLLAPEFERICLNRERLLPGGYHDRAARDASFHLDADPVPNPLATP